MNLQTVLHRQVHPSWVQENQVTSQVFRPTPKDQKQLSVYDGDQISPEDAWVHFSQVLQCESAGVVSVTVQECTSQGLEVHPDPATFPEHALIDYSPFKESAIKRIAKRLKAYADQRGWQFRSTKRR